MGDHVYYSNHYNPSTALSHQSVSSRFDKRTSQCEGLSDSRSVPVYNTPTSYNEEQKSITRQAQSRETIGFHNRSQRLYDDRPPPSYEESQSHTSLSRLKTKTRYSPAWNYINDEGGEKQYSRKRSFSDFFDYPEQTGTNKKSSEWSSDSYNSLQSYQGTPQAPNFPQGRLNPFNNFSQLPSKILSSNHGHQSEYSFSHKAVTSRTQSDELRHTNDKPKEWSSGNHNSSQTYQDTTPPFNFPQRKFNPPNNFSQKPSTKFSSNHGHQSEYSFSHNSVTSRTQNNEFGHQNSEKPKEGSSDNFNFSKSYQRVPDLLEKSPPLPEKTQPLLEKNPPQTVKKTRPRLKKIPPLRNNPPPLLNNPPPLLNNPPPLLNNPPPMLSNLPLLMNPPLMLKNLPLLDNLQLLRNILPSLLNNPPQSLSFPQGRLNPPNNISQQPSTNLSYDYGGRAENRILHNPVTSGSQSNEFRHNNDNGYDKQNRERSRDRESRSWQGDQGSEGEENEDYRDYESEKVNVFIPDFSIVKKYEYYPPSLEEMGEMFKDLVIHFFFKDPTRKQRNPLVLICASFGNSAGYYNLEVEYGFDSNIKDRKFCTVRYQGMMMVRGVGENNCPKEPKILAGFELINKLAMSCYTLESKPEYFNVKRFERMLEEGSVPGIYCFAPTEEVYDFHTGRNYLQRNLSEKDSDVEYILQFPNPIHGSRLKRWLIKQGFDARIIKDKWLGVCQYRTPQYWRDKILASGVMENEKYILRPPQGIGNLLVPDFDIKEAVLQLKGRPRVKACTLDNVYGPPGVGPKITKALPPWVGRGRKRNKRNKQNERKIMDLVKHEGVSLKKAFKTECFKLLSKRRKKKLIKKLG